MTQTLTVSDSQHDDLLDHDLEETLYGPQISSEASTGKSPIFLVIGLLIAVVGVYFLLVDGLSSETYFFTVDEFVARKAELVGQTVRVKGTVVPKSIVGEIGQLERTFRITENEKSVTVVYNKSLPDTFKENVEVVVRGEFNDLDQLVAQEVMVKCPSRYEGSPPGEHPGHIPMSTS